MSPCSERLRALDLVADLVHEVRVEDKDAEADEEDPAEQLRETASPSLSQSALRKSYRDGMGEP